MGHGERRCELERQFPGWEIWYVPREPDGVTWCARPCMLLSAESPEDLAAAVRAAHGGQVVPDSLLLAFSEGDPARVRRLGKPEERAGAARRRTKSRERRRVPRRRGAFRLEWPGGSASGPRHR